MARIVLYSVEDINNKDIKDYTPANVKSAFTLVLLMCLSLISLTPLKVEAASIEMIQQITHKYIFKTLEL